MRINFPSRPVDRLVAAAFERHIRGAGRVAGYIYRGQLNRSVPTCMNGLRWEADPLDWMGQCILKSGTWESSVTACLVEALKPDEVFWDVGANVGVHALTVKASRPDVDVIAFEPSPVQFSRLRQNAANNKLEVSPYCVALADHRGYRDISLVDVGNSGLNSLCPWENVRYDGRFRCWCDTVDDVVREGAPAPHVLKVDVEGGEEAVFAGMRETLAGRTLHTVIFESRQGRSSALLEAGFSVGQVGRYEWLAVR